MRFLDGEQPPPTPAGSRSGLPFKVDLHRVSRVGEHLEPMLAHKRIAFSCTELRMLANLGMTA
jgi:hypothetical protein